MTTVDERRPQAPQGATGSPGATGVSRSFDWRFELVFLAATLGSVVLILSYLGRHAGFPVTQAYGNDLIMTQIYAAHFRHGDIFPIWSSSDAYGLGSPVLLYYQKAFFYVGGALAVILGTALKTTLVLTLALFLIIGSYGMRLAIGTLTNRKVLLVVGSVGYLFTNYVFTDWLVRGDLPEFSSLMIVPWLLYWCLRLVTKREASLIIVPTMILLVDAHSAIALLSLFTLAVTLVVFLSSSGLSGLRKVLGRLIISAACIVIVLAPMLVAELQFARFYDPATKVKDGADLFSDFANPVRYLYDGSYHWNSAGPVFSVQIDFAIWVSVVLGGILLLSWWGRARRARARFRVTRYFDLRALAVLGGSILVYLVLQLRVASWVYRVFTPLQDIDYPSRMLAFITPIGVLLVMALGEALCRRYPGNRIVAWLPAPWLASLILLSPLTSSALPPFGLFVTIPHDHTTLKGIVPSTAFFALPEYMMYGHSLSTFSGTLWGEYLPKVTTAQGTEVNPDTGVYSDLVSEGKAAQSFGGSTCTVAEPAHTPVESLNIRFSVKCDRATRLALPISYNGYTGITAVSSDGRRSSVPYFHSATDPRIIINVPSDRPEVLLVSLPTIWRVLF